MTDFKTWHDYRPEMETAIFSDDRAAFSSIVKQALGADHVEREKGMLIEGNDHGRSYSSMCQADMGKLLIQAGLRWGEEEYVEKGRAAMKVLTVKYNHGGLALKDGDTTWYCGQTSRDDTDRGGTLNKHLYATKALLEVGEMLGEERYVEAGEAGFRKLVEGGDLPMLKDFFVKGEELSRWAYYGVVDANERKVYHLPFDNPHKNADYHQYDMELIWAIGQKVSDDFDWSPFYREQVVGHTALGAMDYVDDHKPWHNVIPPEVKDWFNLWE